MTETPRAAPSSPGPTKRAQRMRRAAGWIGLGLVALALLVMAGWIFGVPGLTQVAPGLVTMKMWTAALFALLGVCVVAAAAQRPRVGLAAALAALTVSGLFLIASLTALRILPDNLLGLDPGDDQTPHPGRPAAMTSLSFVLLSGAWLLLQPRGRSWSGRRAAVAWASQIVAAATSAIGLTAVVGYVYGVDSLYAIGPFSSMALHTGVGVCAGGVALLLLSAAEGFMALFVSDGAGGLFMRRSLPWVFIVPNVVGGVISVGLRAGAYDGKFALVLLVTCVMVAAVALVWVQGLRLRHVDLARGHAQDGLEQAQAAIEERDRAAIELAVAERRARQVIQTAADAYIAIDAEGLVFDWNHAAERIFGYSGDEAKGKPLEELIIGHEHASAHRRGLAHYVATGEGPILGQPLELEALTKARGPITIELTVWADAISASQRFHAFVRDITPRKLSERKLNEAVHDLEAFAAIAAHDLRSPLQTVQMQADVLASTLSEPAEPAAVSEALMWASRIEKTAARGLGLISDLLAYSSVGQVVLATTDIDLDSLVRDIADEQLDLLPRQGDILIDDLPTICGDHSLLSQLLNNLLGNALRYVPEDREPLVRVSAESTPGQGHVVLRVADNCEPIDADDREAIFEMFYRGRSSKGVSGTGVGLAICRRVVERHDGQIWIEAGQESGNVFCVRLPATG